MGRDATGLKINKIVEPLLVLPSITIAELNYVAFGILSNDYHIELYGALQHIVALSLGKTECSVKECDTYIKQHSQYTSAIHEKISTHHTTTYYTLPTYIRNAIDHPDPSRSYSQDDLRCSINLLVELCK